MADEDYDLMPHEEVIRLRREVDEIKQHPFGSSKEGKELLDAISRLSSSMDHLTGLFQEAAEQMKLEERETEMIGSKLDPLFNKMDDLIDQNSKIAKGIIAVADMVKENTIRKSQPMPPPSQRPYSPQQQFAQGIRVEPPSPMAPPSFQQGVPAPMPPSQGMMPPPPNMPPQQMSMPEKKGFFSLGKK